MSLLEESAEWVPTATDMRLLRVLWVLHQAKGVKSSLNHVEILANPLYLLKSAASRLMIMQPKEEP